MSVKEYHRRNSFFGSSQQNKLLFLSNGGKIEDMLKKRIWSHAKTRTLPEELPAAGHPGPYLQIDGSRL